MNYIKEMRALIGNRPLLLVSASVIAIKDDRILLQQRADNGLWAYPGGYMEIGESPEESAKREFHEETGHIAKRLKLYGVFAGEQRHLTYPNGHEVYITDVVYTCVDFQETDDGHDDEVLAVKWVRMNALPDNLSGPVKDILKAFVEKCRCDKTGG